MQLIIMQVTPEEAQVWLDNQARNRRLNPKRVKAYARDMAAGAWEKDTNEPIAINTEGRMIDGQHRCHAIILTGLTVEMPVMFGVKKHVGKPITRRSEDVATIVYDLDIGRVRISIVKAMFLSTPDLTDHEVIKLYLKHQIAIDFAASILGKKLNLSNAPVGSVYARAFYHLDTDIIEAFAQVLLTGICRSPEDSAAVLLRDQLRPDNRRPSLRIRTTYDRKEIIRRTEQALKYFADRYPAKSLRASNRELFPLSDVPSGEGERGVAGGVGAA